MSDFDPNFNYEEDFRLAQYDTIDGVVMVPQKIDFDLDSLPPFVPIEEIAEELGYNIRTNRGKYLRVEGALYRLFKANPGKFRRCGGPKLIHKSFRDRCWWYDPTPELKQALKEFFIADNAIVHFNIRCNPATGENYHVLEPWD